MWCTRSDNASSPPASSQPHGHFCIVALAHGRRSHYTLWYANVAGSHNSMRSIGYFTGGRAKLYAVRACCTVCNTHAERFCKAIAEWVMFEADLCRYAFKDKLFFQFGHYVNIGVQRNGFPAPVL